MEILSTVLVLLVLTGIVGLIVRSMIKAKRAGRSVICGGSCSGCGGACGCHLILLHERFELKNNFGCRWRFLH